MEKVKPENNPNHCQSCKGTGKDKNKVDGRYVRCWDCNGNGLDPAAYVRWTPKAP